MADCVRCMVSSQSASKLSADFFLICRVYPSFVPRKRILCFGRIEIVNLSVETDSVATQN